MYASCCLVLCLALAAFISFPLCAQAKSSGGIHVTGPSEASGFPFIPLDMDVSGPVSAAFLNDHRAGSLGRVRSGTDGHLWLGDRRIRFLGLNCTWIPAKEQAPELARRLSALGVNILRFHHMDAPWGETLLSSRVGKPAEPDPVMMDRLDFFIACLEDQGIYCNLNLLTGRQFSSGDGLPAEIDKVADAKARHSIGFWDPGMQDLQKAWARKYLGHLNPYTKKTYLEDPAVAVVEINNENGLVQTWMGGQIDDLPEIFVRDLRAGWNAWLKAKYGSAAGMTRTLNLARELGPELLLPLAEKGRVGAWTLEQHGTARASLTALPDINGVRLEVTQASSESWHVQLNLPRLDLAAGDMHTLRFKARKSPGLVAQTTLEVGLGMAHEPWAGLGFGRSITLGADWQEFIIPIASLTQSDANARLNFSGLGIRKGGVDIADVSLRTGGSLLVPGTSIDTGDLPLPLAREREGISPALMADWIAFLWEKEDAYWKGMKDWLVKDLGVKSLIAGTIVGCSPPSLLEHFDIVDTHAYWNHPSFPGTAWDPYNNWVGNRSLTRDFAGGTLTDLAQRRIAGKPFSVSEYDHPRPNQYLAEMYPLLASFACFQDWDMIYGFTMEVEPSGGPTKIAGFFDQLSNPLKASAMPLAARIFREGLLKPGKTPVVFRSGVRAEKEALSVSGAWNLPDFGRLGLDRSLALRYRLALSLDPADANRGLAEIAAANAALAKSVPAGNPGDFEGGELSWHPREGRFVVLAPELLGGIRVEDLAGTGKGGQDVWPDFVLGSPLWGIELHNRQNFAALLVVPRGPAGWYAATGYSGDVKVSGSAKGKPHLLVWTGRAAGNTKEGLLEYAGPRKRPGKAAPDPFTLDRVAATWQDPDAKGWALGGTWELAETAGWKVAALDARGKPVVLTATTSTAGPVVLSPVDRTLWYELIRY